MDVAPRQAFVAGVVPPGERTATMGITNIAKSIGAAFGPLATGYLASRVRPGAWAVGLPLHHDSCITKTHAHACGVCWRTGRVQSESRGRRCIKPHT